jgi:hypothetical protein
MVAAEILRNRVAYMRGYPQWRGDLDEVFVKVNGKHCYLWRAVDHEGEVLEAGVTAKRDKAAALKILKRIMKTYGRPQNRHRRASRLFCGDEKWTSRDALPHWPSGAPSRPNGRLGLGELRYALPTCRYSDETHSRQAGGDAGEGDGAAHAAEQCR